MAKRLLPPDWHVTKDNGDPATDATILVRIAGSSTPTPAYSDKELATSLGSTINCDATGYPASGGNDVALWGADTISYDLIVQATGYNGGAAKTLEDVAVADDTTAYETTSSLALGNAFDNGGFESWSYGTTFSNISGSGAGVQVADGWYLSQSNAASNAVSRQAGFTVEDFASSRYSLRIGRGAGSTSVDQLRLWKVLRPELCYRLRGQEVALRYSVRVGSTYVGDTTGSGQNFRVILATGTTESESGDLIQSSGFAGHANAVSSLQAATKGSAQRFEHVVTLPNNIKEIGIQFSFTGAGTADATDYLEIQDVELKLASDQEEFHARPEALDFLLSNLSTGGRLFNATAFTDPGADRVMIWDESANDFVGATLGTGISISGTTISLDDEVVDLAGLTPTDGNFIVGDGSAFVTESGATARASLSLGSSDSPTFNGLTLTSLSVSNGAAAATPAATITNTNDNAGVTALVIQGDRATPAANDTLDTDWRLSDSAGNQDTMFRIRVIATSVTNTTESVTVRFAAMAAGSLVNYVELNNNKFGPVTNDGLPLGTAAVSWSDLFLASGGVINGNNGNATITHVTGGWEVGGTFRARTALSSETSGTLTSASANKRVKATAGVTINDGVFTAEDAVEIYNDSDVSITITQDTGMTLRLAGTTSTGNRTLAARGVAYVYFDTNADAAVAGSGVS